MFMGAHPFLAGLFESQAIGRGNGLAAGFMHFYRLLYNVFAVLSFVPIMGNCCIDTSKTLYCMWFHYHGLD